MDRVASNGRPSMLRNLRLLGTFLVLWAVPVGALYLWRGGNDVLVDQALFFTGAAFVTFGGAYAVLSYISDVAVNQYGWLTAEPDGQGLGSPSQRVALIMVPVRGFSRTTTRPFHLHRDLGLDTTYASFCVLLFFPARPMCFCQHQGSGPPVGGTAAVSRDRQFAVFFARGPVLWVSFGPNLRLIVAVDFVVLQKYKVPLYSGPCRRVGGMLTLCRGRAQDSGHPELHLLANLPAKGRRWANEALGPSIGGRRALLMMRAASR